MRRYSGGARFYDILSGERFVYRRGRIAGIELLRLRPGDTVFDLGCGTGLNFPFLLDAVGPTGRVVGLDRSPDMLRMARRRIDAARWSNVEVVEADASSFEPAELIGLNGGAFDAVFSSYALSVVGDWHPAWTRMAALVRPGGRAGIVDMAYPTGWASILSPLARAVCAIGGADLTAHPWTALESAGTDVTHLVLGGGHIHSVAATLASAE